MQQILLTSKQENHNHTDKNLQCPQCYHYVTKPLDLPIYYAYLQQILAPCPNINMLPSIIHGICDTFLCQQDIMP